MPACGKRRRKAHTERDHGLLCSVYSRIFLRSWVSRPPRPPGPGRRKAQRERRGRERERETGTERERGRRAQRERNGHRERGRGTHGERRAQREGEGGGGCMGPRCRLPQTGTRRLRQAPPARTPRSRSLPAVYNLAGTCRPREARLKSPLSCPLHRAVRAGPAMPACARLPSDSETGPHDSETSGTGRVGQ